MSSTAETVELPTFPFVNSLEMDHDPEGIRLLAEKPVVRARLPDGNQAWVALSYETARRVVTDNAFSRQAAVEPDAPAVAPAVSMPDALTGMDGAEHAAVRKLVTKAFTPRMVERMRPWVDELAGGLLDRIDETGPPVDLADRYTAPIPMMVICQLLGIPYEDRDQFCAAADRQVSAADTLTIDEIMAGIAQLQDYIRQLVEMKRVHPGEDLTTEFIRVADEGTYLTERQLINNLFLVLTAGHETTVSQLSNSLVSLLSEPERYQQLCRQPELIPNAIEELLRYLILTHTGLFIRIATKDMDLGGQPIRAGDAVIALHNVANRDPAVFDHPNHIDFARGEANKHLSFGAGPHFCVGAQLARMEMQIALTKLIERFPTLRLAVPPEELEWKPGRVIRRVTALPVEW